MEEKFCKYCGAKIAVDAIICTSCGRQIDDLKTISQNSTEQWYYSINGQKFGPISEEQIIKLISEKKITETSLIWTQSMQDWQPLLNSKFKNLINTSHSPPPLTGTAVSNVLIWFLAFTPLIGIILEAFFSELLGIPEESLWFITVILNIVLSHFDEKNLEKAGHDTSNMGSSWLIPVYLFKRAKMLKHNYAYFIVWCVLFVLLFVL